MKVHDDYFLTNETVEEVNEMWRRLKEENVILEFSYHLGQLWLRPTDTSETT